MGKERPGQDFLNSLKAWVKLKGAEEELRDEKLSQKYLDARQTVPEELWAEFEKLVTEYKYRATVRYGSAYISYIVLADLIRSGWRLTGPDLDDASRARTKDRGNRA